MTFQNCKVTDTPIPKEAITSTEKNPENKSVTVPEKIGSIVQIDSESGESIEDQTLSINSDITFKFLNAGTDSDNYKWTIKRGFGSVVEEASTQTDTYSTKFSELGAYDVFAISYKATEPKARASKRFVVGESCSLNDILEIELLSENSASLKIGGSGHSTFGLRDSSNFSSIKWKATLPSGQVIESEGEDTLEVDLSSESRGLLVIEVSATSSITSRNGCLVHGRKELIVTSNVRPYFNPISFADGIDNIPVILENEIYKYEKPDMLFFQIEVLNADSCQYQINGESKADFNCGSGEFIEILSSLGADCIKGIVTLFASENQGEVHSQSYYYYCSAEGDDCYFGTVSERPDHHVCSAEVANPVNGSCGSAEGICQSGQPRDTQDTETHYQWQCVGSEGGTTEDCQEAKTINTTSTTIQGCPSGEHRSRTVCENVKPSNSTCSKQDNECYKWSCNSGYRRSGDSCVESCPSGQYDSQNACNTASPDNSTCSLQDNSCYSWSCDSGYTQSGDLCVRSQLSIDITHFRIPDIAGKVVAGCQNNTSYNACVFGIGNTKNYGVNILDTINNFLENSSYKIVINGLQRATVVSGKWTRPYNSDPNFNNSQANLYHWLMYQKEWMELNANTWYASDKDITAEIRDVNSDRTGGFWSWGRNLMSFPRSNNLFWLIFHEAGHANLYYSRGRYVRRENQTRCLSTSGGSRNLCCTTYKGCFSAINEGQAEFHEYLINNLSFSSSERASVSSRRKRRCKSNITLKSTAKTIFADCDTVFPEGQVHTLGFLIYATIWYEIYNHSDVNKKYITILFSEHLPLLKGDDTFVTAGAKIVSLARQLFDESTGTKYAKIIKIIFKNRGLPLDE